MNRKRKSGLHREFWLRTALPAFAAMVLFIAAVFLIIIPTLSAELTKSKLDMARELGHSAASVIKLHVEDVKNGLMTEEEAKRQAVEHVRAMRYGPQDKDYFWITDHKPVMIMHPYRPELDGQDVGYYRDSAGNQLFVDMVKVIEEKGEGFVSYNWQWKDDPSRVLSKKSFVTEVPEWGWIIGTGVYVDDVDAHVSEVSQRMSLAILGTLVLVALLVAIMVRQGLAAEEVRADLMTDLERKNAELERFSYTVSHDLKSPLVTIRGFLHVLREDIDKNDLDSIEHDIERISNASIKMNQLLDDVLELSRVGRQINTVDNVDLRKIINGCVDLLSGKINERGVKVDISGDFARICADPVRLGEVFQNLVENAIKYMGSQQKPEIRVFGELDGTEGVNRISVIDNGMGIDPRYHENVFGLFNKLDSGSEGTGVGLSLVKRIVELHGGQISIESEGKDKGCIFIVELPIPDSGTK